MTRGYNEQLISLFPDEFKNDRTVKTITFQVTDDCCMACTYCYQINKHHNKMDFGTAKSLVDQLLDLEHPFSYANIENTGGIIFEFIGGEPFMEIELIQQICDYITDKMIEKDHPWLFRHRFSICSNGLLYFTPAVQNFIERYNSRLSFNISIDGNKKLHDACRVDLLGNGTYDRAIAAVKHYKEHFHGDMGSKMTLAPQNIKYTKEAVIGLIESGYTEINLNCVFEKGWTIEHAKIFYQQLTDLADWLIEHDYNHSPYEISIFSQSLFHPKDENENENWCGGVGLSMLACDYKGDLYPCIRYMESSLGEDQKPIIIGNVEHGTFITDEEKAWLSELEGVTRRSQSTDECFNCPIAEGCAWCSAYNYQEFGTTNHRATYICVMHKARALANAYYYNTQFQLEGSNKRMKIYLPKEQALEIIDEEEWEKLKLLEAPINFLYK